MTDTVVITIALTIMYRCNHHNEDTTNDSLHHYIVRFTMAGQAYRFHFAFVDILLHHLLQVSIAGQPHLSSDVYAKLYCCGKNTDRA
jgi:hypothetical protein